LSIYLNFGGFSFEKTFYRTYEQISSSSITDFTIIWVFSIIFWAASYCSFFLSYCWIYQPLHSFWEKGISYTFSKPQKIVSTYFAGLIGAYIFAGVGILITKILLGSSPNSNPVADGMTIFGLLKTIPMLLGEELITIILLIIIANLLGGTRKALIVAVIISTLIFGFLHLPTYDWNFAQVIFIIAAARIPFTLASLRSDSLYTGLLIHITYDWIIFILVILSHH
jgi:uncharacterized protein